MTTIDTFHKQQMKYFHEIKNNIIPNFQKEREILKNKIIVEKDLETKLFFIDKLKEIKQNILKIKFLEKNYLLKNMNHLEVYYTNQKEIENNNNNKINVNDYFNIIPNEKILKNTSLSHQEFWNANNKPTIQYYNQNICQSCNIELRETEDGFYICNICSFINTNRINENKNDISLDRITNNSCYLRLSYFKKIINQLNGRPTMKIKPEIIQIIKDRIDIEKIQIINYNVIKELLKKLKQKQYIDQTVHIMSLIGINIIQMPDILVNKLIVLFQSLQIPFAKYCPKIRINFFPYHFIIYKLLIHLGETQYIHHIPILKNIEKNQNQNELFNKCINEISI